MISYTLASVEGTGASSRSRCLPSLALDLQSTGARRSTQPRFTQVAAGRRVIGVSTIAYLWTGVWALRRQQAVEV